MIADLHYTAVSKRPGGFQAYHFYTIHRKDRSGPGGTQIIISMFDRIASLAHPAYLKDLPREFAIPPPVFGTEGIKSLYAYAKARESGQVQLQHHSNPVWNANEPPLANAGTNPAPNTPSCTTPNPYNYSTLQYA